MSGLNLSPLAPPESDKHIKKELLTYSDYTRQLTKPSAIVHGLIVPDKEIMRCPRCGIVQGGIEHGDTQECRGCSLRMQVYGNALYIWEREVMLLEAKGGD